MNTGPAEGAEPGEDVFDVDGLQDDVEIIVDHWGVPHIFGGSRGDVFLAQGFNAARDRLFQIDLWRRRGLGLLAEAFGPAYVEQDEATRLLLYRGEEEAEWASYAEGTRQAARSFVAGVNAFVRLARADPRRLPPEFARWDYEPALWEPFDLVRFRTHGLFYNADHEIDRARALRHGGTQAERIRQSRQPDTPIVVPDGLDLSRLDDVLRLYHLAFAPVDFSGAPDPDAARLTLGGSNNWVVDGSRTSTGRPLLANDPHRAVTVPSLRYLSHLIAPDLDVIGAGEPGLPGISIGHNGRVAFGLTIWPADVEDLYVYDLDPNDPDRYLGPNGWAAFEVVEERVPVRDSDAVPVVLRFTQHGPVIHRDAERGFAIALRAVWLEPGMAPYVASIGYNDARDGDEFLAALRLWGAPAVNQIFATPDGDWGWQASGRLPRRAGWDGSLPVPGHGSYEWNGFATTAELPSERRHDRGWFASANEFNVPDSFSAGGLTVTHDWYSPARAERLRGWLESDAAVSVDSSNAMQSDVVSVHALRLLDLLGGLVLDDPVAAAELDALRRWNGALETHSREGLVFEIWARRHLRPWLTAVRLEHAGVEAANLDAATRSATRDESLGGDLRGVLLLVEWMREELGDAESARVVERSLIDALAEITRRLGAEGPGDAWEWGRLHHVALSHPARGPRTVSGQEPDVGPLPRGGSGDTVGLAAYDQTFGQTVGSTFRMVIDVGDWDKSVVSNSPGQSGDPRSSHYADLFQDWVDGRPFPLSYSRAAIERNAERRIVLRPREIRRGDGVASES